MGLQKQVGASLFVCTACRKGFSMRIQLRLHQKAAHSNISPEPPDQHTEMRSTPGYNTSISVYPSARSIMSKISKKSEERLSLRSCNREALKSVELPSTVNYGAERGSDSSAGEGSLENEKMGKVIAKVSPLRSNPTNPPDSITSTPIFTQAEELPDICCGKSITPVTPLSRTAEESRAGAQERITPLTKDAQTSDEEIKIIGEVAAGGSRLVKRGSDPEVEAASKTEKEVKLLEWECKPVTCDHCTDCFKDLREWYDHLMEKHRGTHSNNLDNKPADQVRESQSVLEYQEQCESQQAESLDTHEGVTPMAIDTTADTMTSTTLSSAAELKDRMDALLAKHLTPKGMKLNVTGIIQTCPHPGCGKTFTSVRQLRAHRLRVHEKSFRPCRICPRKFPSSTELYWHFKRAHETNKRDHLDSASDSSDGPEAPDIQEGVGSQSNNKTSVHISDQSDQICESGEIVCQSIEPPDSITNEHDACNNDVEATLAIPTRPAGDRILHSPDQYVCPACPQQFRRESLLLFHLRTKHRVFEEEALAWFREHIIGKPGPLTIPFSLNNAQKGRVSSQRQVIICFLCNSVEGKKALEKHLQNFHLMIANAIVTKADIPEPKASFEGTKTIIPTETMPEPPASSLTKKRESLSGDDAQAEDVVCNQNWTSMQSPEIGSDLQSTPSPAHSQQNTESSDSGCASEVLENEESSCSDSNANASAKSLSDTPVASSESGLPSTEIADEGRGRTIYRKLKCPYCKKVITRPNYMLGHIWKHHDKKFKLNCSLCSHVDFQKLRDLFHHQRKVHGAYRLEESIQYSYRRDLSSHRAVLSTRSTDLSRDGDKNSQRKLATPKQRKLGRKNGRTSVVRKAAKNNKKGRILRKTFASYVRTPVVLKFQESPSSDSGCASDLLDDQEAASSHSNLDGSDKSLGSCATVLNGFCSPVAVTAVKKRISGGSYKLKCPYCKIAFSSTPLMEHIKNEHNKDFKLKCLLCPLDFRTFAGLYSHHSKAHGRRSYCSKRSLRYSCSGDLSSRHTVRRGKSSKFSQDAPEEVSGKDSSEGPLMTKLGTLGRHNVSASDVAEGAKSSETGDMIFKPFACYICEKCFRWKGACRRHLRNVHFGGTVAPLSRKINANKKVTNTPCSKVRKAITAPRLKAIAGVSTGHYARRRKNKSRVCSGDGVGYRATEKEGSDVCSEQRNEREKQYGSEDEAEEDISGDEAEQEAAVEAREYGTFICFLCDRKHRLMKYLVKHFRINHSMSKEAVQIQLDKM